MNRRNVWSVILAVLTTALVLSRSEAKTSGGALVATEKRVPLSLTVDPSFRRDQLTGDVRLWYDRLWAAIGNPNPGSTFVNEDERSTSNSGLEMAAMNDVYVYGRSLGNYVAALLHVFRITGEKALLDRVDEIAQVMRAQLEDWSIQKMNGKDYEADGYLNWVRKQFKAPQYIGTDVHQMDEMMTHALVAQFAYAFKANQEIDPKYAERARFWTDYLRNHFEAKWRKRLDKPTGKFMEKTLTHVYIDWTRYHYYMHRLTGEEWYLTEAERRAKVFAAEMVEVNNRTAFVWDHRTIHEKGEKPMQAQPFTYTRYTTLYAVDLAYEKFSVFTPEFMRKMAAGVREFILDNGATDFGPDIAGGVVRGGVPQPKKPRARETPSKYVVSNYVELAVWDDTGKIASVSQDVYRAFESDPDKPKRVHIPAGMVQLLLLKDGSLR